MTTTNNNFFIKQQDHTTLKEILVDETIFSLSNGQLGARGQFTEGYGTNHFPVTLLNGFYYEYDYYYEEQYPGLPLKGQSIINLPDTSHITLLTTDGRINLSQATLLDLQREYNLQTGCTNRVATYKTKMGHIFAVREQKLVSAHQNLVVQKLTVSSTNYSGELSFVSHLRFPVTDDFDRSDPRLPYVREKLDFKTIKTTKTSASLTTCVKDTQNKYLTASIAHNKPCNIEKLGTNATATHTTTITPTTPASITKYSYYSTEQAHTAKQLSSFVLPFEDYLEQEKTTNHALWNTYQIQLNNATLQDTLRYNAYQLFRQGLCNQTAIAAKGTSGEGYDGHYFWDTELFMLPFFVFTNPQKAKEFLLFRYKHLNLAKQEAKKLGVMRGAKIPWRTINGTESAPNFLAGSAEIHINSDVAYAIKTYYNATKDLDFMLTYGAELLLETALFLLDYGNFDTQGNFHICQVTGPDEYTMLEDDNYYTNKQAQAHFLFAVQFVSEHQTQLSKLLQQLSITPETLAQLKRAANHMTLLTESTQKIMQQDAGFLQKKQLTLSDLSNDMFPLFLHAHPQFLCQHQVQKQADVVLANVLFEPKQTVYTKNTFDYYLQRTAHDSSLSECVYSINAFGLGQQQKALDLFESALLYDFNNKDKFTRYGLHFANIGGSFLMVLYGIFGVRADTVLQLNPSKQSVLDASISFVYQGANITLTVQNNQCTFKTNKLVQVAIYGKSVLVKDTVTFDLQQY